MNRPSMTGCVSPAGRSRIKAEQLLQLAAEGNLCALSSLHKVFGSKKDFKVCSRIGLKGTANLQVLHFTNVRPCQQEKVSGHDLDGLKSLQLQDPCTANALRMFDEEAK